MSTIKVNNIVPPNVGEGVSIDGLQMPTAGALSNRNMFINGEAAVAQRATSVTGLTTGGTSNQSVDLFRGSIASLGTWTNSQDADAPDGFSKSFKLQCTTANASPGSGSVLAIDLMLEAQNLQRLGYGTTGAKVATLSFYVKSNKTGAASVTILQSDNSNRCISPSYTINSANTWERKTITLPADTAGVINNDNGRGLVIEMWLNSGSTYTGGSNQNDWGTLVNANRNASNLGLGGSTSDYWQITGVQLEVGSKSTEYEHESYAQTLAKCKRYYEVVSIPGSSYSAQYSNNGTFYGSPIFFTVEKRVVPTTITYQEISGSSYWVEVGQRSFSANSEVGINFSLVSTTSTRIFQTRVGGGTSPTRVFSYLWEPSFNVLITAEL